MVHTCNSCKKDFKYESILKRHLAKKIPCKNIIINPITHEDNNINILPFDNNTNNDLFNTLSNKLSKTQIINILISLINSNSNNLIDNNIIDNNINDNNIKNNMNNSIDTTDNIVNLDNITDKQKTKYSCKNCNSLFYDRQGVYKHNKLNRCKGKKEIVLEEDIIIPDSKQNSGTSFNDILGINFKDSDNNNITNSINNTTNNNPIINNTTNNNNKITNNNITININPFGCESLEHITTLQFISLFKNFNHFTKISYNLSDLVYIKNGNNMNFTKNNMNKNIVTYLDYNMELKQISEREFIKEFEHNIKKLCIELFHIHKNDISLDDLIEYMKSLLLFYDTIQENKINHSEIKEELKCLIDFVFRDKDINEVIRKIKLDLQNDKELRIYYEKNNSFRLREQKKRLNEYYFAPNANTTDTKNLYKIKELAIQKNIEDRKNILEKNLKDKYNKKLEKLEQLEQLNNKKMNNNEKIENPIILKIDASTGLIIDDRED
jgi:hypothetical protein